MNTLTKAASDVLAERQRQIEREGYDTSHDDAHNSGELSAAASAYAWAASCQVETDKPAEYSGTPPAMWPWDSAAWNLKDERRNLVRAAALILAEIERLDRAAGTSGVPASDGKPSRHTPEGEE